MRRVKFKLLLAIAMIIINLMVVFLCSNPSNIRSNYHKVYPIHLFSSHSNLILLQSH